MRVGKRSLNEKRDPMRLEDRKTLRDDFCAVSNNNCSNLHESFCVIENITPRSESAFALGRRHLTPNAQQRPEGVRQTKLKQKILRPCLLPWFLCFESLKVQICFQTELCPFRPANSRRTCKSQTKIEKTKTQYNG